MLTYADVCSLHHYLKDGFNTVIVCGSTASVLFLNQVTYAHGCSRMLTDADGCLRMLTVVLIHQNIATLDGGFQLEPSWVEGPYEAQAAQVLSLLALLVHEYRY